jgi:hypothetical protein
MNGNYSSRASIGDCELISVRRYAKTEIKPGNGN